jgi:GIY-YIG catalytic domain
MIAQLRPILDRLLAAPKHPLGTHQRGTIPAKPGLYLFSDAEGKPIYVGQSRNIRNRVAQHCNENGDHNSASFAFNIAKTTATRAGVDIAGYRSDIVAREKFVTQFLAGRQLVARMPVQFVLEEHPDVHTVFEVYATHALGTQEYNTFETH